MRIDFCNVGEPISAAQKKNQKKNIKKSKKIDVFASPKIDVFDSPTIDVFDSPTIDVFDSPTIDVFDSSCSAGDLNTSMLQRFTAESSRELRRNAVP